MEYTITYNHSKVKLIRI